MAVERTPSIIEISTIDDLEALVSHGDLEALAEVRKLSLDEAGLTALPDWLGDLSGVEEIHLEDNLLPSLPATIGEIERLPSLGGSASLSVLDLRNNRLRSLPRSIGALIHLTRLDLRGNRLRSLPDAIGELPKLQKLDLRWNKLAPVPKWIWKLKQYGCTVYH